MDATHILTSSLSLLLQGTLVTIKLAAASMLLGLCGGIAVGVLNCERLQNRCLGALLSGFVWTIRGTPLFVQVLIAYYALPEWLGFSLSPFAAGVLALAVNSTAYISEIVRGGINAIPKGQWEAAYVIGLTSWQTLKGVILPQMLRISLPSLTNELTALIKETSILMVIGVAELTKVAKDIVARELDPMSIYLAAAAIYLILTTTVSLLSRYAMPKEAL